MCAFTQIFCVQLQTSRKWRNDKLSRAQWRSQPKGLAGQHFLILGYQQHFVWDTALQSTKW